MTDPVQDILERLDAVKKTGPDQWQARCPAHGDQNPSLSIGRGDDGRALLHCQAGCSTMAVCKALDLPMQALFPPDQARPQSRIVATYDYRDAQGNLLFQSVRFEPKDFRQRRSDGNGGWLWDLGDTPRVLYRLPELAAADPAQWVFIVEGEKDADNLAAAGLVATCNPMGAGKWSKLSGDSPLHGRRVAILPDKDAPGRKHAQDVAQRLNGKAAQVKIIELAGDVKDASDWLAAGGTAAELLALVEAATPYEQPVEPEIAAAAAPDEPVVKLGQPDPATGRLVLSPRRTLPTADAFINAFHSHPEGRTIHGHGGVFMVWRDNRFVEAEDQAVRKQLQSWLHEALRYVFDKKTNELELVDFESNPTTINAALESLRVRAHLPASIVPPAWLDGKPERPPATEILPCRSYNLHISSETVLPPTPALFTTNALDFDFDRHAPWPEAWLDFLEQLWGDDQQSIALLQEWFGYCLTADTSQQKMLLLVGPKRSGKGTIGRILSRLVGPANVAGPTTSGLAGPFGLQPLVGKSLAIVSDARFTGNDVGTVIERLLCISGEDNLTIERKFLPALTMKLPTRFVFLTNELPRINDASGALANRFLLLTLRQSFYGHEDTHLTSKLMSELPGILLWALQGWVRLHDRGYFELPTSSSDTLQDVEELSSPVGAFVRDCCIIGAGHRSRVEDLYGAWKGWCQKDGRNTTTTRQTFGRDLLAAVPGLTTRRNQATGRFYEGISLSGVSNE
ncbi:MAG: phage/plasmid primase, P4 family [Planctomycetaceae bacterium]|nr:phage/plasmid primase, P4 family [Planctomycetaceae bacterium]